MQEVQAQTTPSTPSPPVTTPPVTPFHEPVTTHPSMPITTPPLQGGVVTLRDVDVYSNCTTSIEDTCRIDPAPGSGLCFTPDIVLNRTGVCDNSSCIRAKVTNYHTHVYTPHTNIHTQEFVLNINCVRAVETPEPNPLVFTLDASLANRAACICQVPNVNGVGVSNPVTCGIQVTRCPVPQHITTTVRN